MKWTFSINAFVCVANHSKRETNSCYNRPRVWPKVAWMQVAQKYKNQYEIDVKSVKKTRKAILQAWLSINQQLQFLLTRACTYYASLANGRFKRQNFLASSCNLKQSFSKKPGEKNEFTTSITAVSRKWQRLESRYPQIQESQWCVLFVFAWQAKVYYESRLQIISVITQSHFAWYLAQTNSLPGFKETFVQSSQATG